RAVAMGLILSIPAEILAIRDGKGKTIPYCKMNPTVFLTVGDDGGNELGTIAIKLSKRTHGALTDNFVKLCTGEEMDCISGTRLSLTGTSLWSDGVIVGGGELIDTMGRAATPSGFFTQNSPSLFLSRTRCSLAMLPVSHHKQTFTSLFFFVKSGMDRISDGIIFGDVVQGGEVLDTISQAIEAKRKVTITKSGLI
ncbi:hypothetical protein PFISCL1PPCAC_2545, partial [Pristionchus fissidentatus]